ncbi:Gfo/Idh/MocA family oxidoreductase [Planotetraspora phitsanulokensis]|uniref:Oxidoreductase n=1 Tax=Planotetraspora phitsanulokensis TaxID=575192 RepID=A0A8J3XCJ8_9ACTN|nr:Gfo/Idh/MocA family oxidoreductase [Planotetraspora phitsanulokensis]GII36217.1 oxidoreductase [Planotetraspora phitsanulokensis]
MSRPVTLVVVGAGMRGTVYARHAVAAGARVVAVADPDPRRREAFAVEHGLAPEHVHADWTALAAQRSADAAVIASPDGEHADQAVAFARSGHHLLLEKPMATSEADALRIVDAVAEAGVILTVCHVLRYTVYTRVLTSLLAAGRIGEIVSVQHLEPVGWWHQAHSFVRGNWRREQDAPMLLAKSCHDIDWLLHVTGRRVERVSSFGSLKHFTPANRPDGAADRCLDCAVEATCPYSAPRLYLDCLNDPDRTFWPLSVVTSDHTEEGVRRALREGPYGRCVYACDNSVVDHQVVSWEFAGGGTVTFTMTAFTPQEQRRTRIFGTHGYLEGDGTLVKVTDFRTGREEVVDTSAESGAAAADGHGGGDGALVDAFLRAVAAGDPSLVWTDAATSLDSHRVVWAAEQARHTATVVTLPPPPP